MVAKLRNTVKKYTEMEKQFRINDYQSEKGVCFFSFKEDKIEDIKYQCHGSLSKKGAVYLDT